MKLVTKTSALRRWALAAAAMGAVVVLAGCGGGGDRVSDFRPTRLLAFGDQNSVIQPDGRRYTVNVPSAADPSLIDCNANPIWVQRLASVYGLALPNCSAAAPASRIYAASQASADDVAAQVDLHLSSGGLSATDLVTVLAGQNDIFQQYERVKTSTVTEAQAAEELAQAGIRLAAQVNRMANAGGRVLILTVPDLGLTPYARLANDGPLVSRLTLRFNNSLRDNIINDGKRIGIVLANELTQLIAERPSVYDHDNATSASCTVDVPACTSPGTIVSGANPGRWLWADSKHLGPGGHARLGELARVRATTNPF